MNVDRVTGQFMDPKTDIGFTFKEAVDRIDALMVRWRALRPGEIAAGVPPNKTSLAEGVRHLRLRDDSWDDALSGHRLVRAIHHPAGSRARKLLDSGNTLP